MKFIFPLRLLTSMDLPLAIPYRWMKKYENKSYKFKVAGFYDKSQSLALFMSIDNYGNVFDLKENEFSGFLSDSRITDIDEDNIATTITIHDITKNGRSA